MAGKIKGITIEIGGDTQPLQKALRGVTKESQEASKELKAIDKALKFDTGNVTLLTQKQEVLQKQVTATKEKLEILRQAQGQVERQFQNGEIGADQYRAFKRELEVTQSVLKTYEGQLASVTKSMSSHGDTTQAVKTKLSGLQDEQKRLASESEKLVSSFKLQESQLGKNASESERLALAEKKVASQSDLLERQIKNLDQQLDLTKQSYGENSVEANKMETQLNQAKESLAKLNDELRETGGASDQAQDGMETVANTLRAEALATVGDKMGELSQHLLDIGWKGMEAAAGLQASQAQFATVFGELEGQARSSLNKIGSDLQIVPERLQGSFTQMAAFAKTSGLDTAAALDLTERATRAAADGAAFYDKSIEEVTESLQSFLKGNFENDAALGISATETTRNAKANELYGESFNKLSESQKQLTLLAMVEDGNKLSGALGQASREADGFENVLGNLKQSGENALSALGQPILEAMIPLFQLATQVIQSLAIWFGNLAQPIQEAVVLFGALLAGIGLVLPIFLSLQVAAAALGTSVGAMLVSFLPVVGTILGIAAAIAVLVVGVKHLWETNEGFRDGVLLAWQVISDTITQFTNQVISFVMTLWGQLTTWWQENQALIQESAQVVWASIQAVVETVMSFLGPYLEAALANLQLIFTTSFEVIKTIVSAALDFVLGIAKATMQLLTGDWSGALETLKVTFEQAWLTIQSVAQIILSALVQYISNCWLAVQTTLSGIFSGIVSLCSSIWQSISSTVTSVLSGISSTVSSTWLGVQQTISNAINGAKEAVSSAINAIKNLFNFKFQWPHIPLPHFSISGSANPLDWLKGGLPSISVAWYAKGGILTKPTAFGMNGNQLMVGGEAGREAVLPLNRSTLGEIGRGIAETMGQAPITVSVTISDTVVREEADIVRLADEVARRLSQALEREKGLRGGCA
ncbi:phage tail tape measure protein [Streptococcus pluranimalium]|uniref:Phage tail tape measure protein n=1 Tax=Streptococcus pluranimalium TaxID=82348 RepID=A0A2L0D4W7_9STRE|nr:phage tail tape measure protein [Streptococcus pluranimalium]AUW96734.1 phage tail tape measure protein [Streptococcus pluranimalium]